MKTRSAAFELDYNGQRVSVAMGQYATAVSYVDVASGESDSLDISIQDAAGEWLEALPQKGDVLNAKLRALNWYEFGDEYLLDCGQFLLDDFSFSGPPTTGTISGVSVTSDTGFMETKKSRTWEGVTPKQIAGDIAANAGVDLVFDAEADFVISSIEQSGQTDSEFLYKLCQNYGLSMKVFNTKIIIFDREVYKAKAVAATINKADLQSWSWKTTLAGTYTGGTISYTDPQTEEDIEYAAGSGARKLNVTEKADSLADAERKLKAAINNANHGATALSITVKGNPYLVAGQTVKITGMGEISGKYYIDRATHDMGSGYTVSYELSLVEEAMV